MKKKIIVSLLVITLAFSGCGRSEASTSNISEPSSDESIPEPAADEQEEREAEENNIVDTSNNTANENLDELEKKMTNSSISIEPAYEDGSPKKELQDYAVDIIMGNYTYTDIESISINDNLGTEEEGDYIILARLIWNQKNKASTSKEMLSMYSSDFAARIGMDQSSVKEVAIFWTVPYLDNAGAKWAYERVDTGMQLSDTTLDSIFSE